MLRVWPLTLSRMILAGLTYLLSRRCIHAARSGWFLPRSDAKGEVTQAFRYCSGLATRPQSGSGARQERGRFLALSYSAADSARQAAGRTAGGPERSLPRPGPGQRVPGE